MSHPSPKFSIIIPTRNRPHEFSKALDSVLNQTYKHIEIIVVNDGSNQEHQAQYSALKTTYPNNVFYIDLIERSRGHGHCFARNQGIEKAQGKFICFLDDDDWWTDDTFLERAEQEIQKHGADFYFANQKAVTYKGEHIKNVWVENLPETLHSEDARQQKTVFKVTIDELLNAAGFPHMNCWAISKELFLNAGGMDENLRYEPDRDIYLRALNKANCILYDKSTVALHNIPEPSQKKNASTQTNKIEKILFQLRTADKGILFLEKKELVVFCKKNKGYLLKKLSEELSSEKKYTLAFSYAKQGLAVSFTIKWLLYTLLCGYKKIIYK